MARAKNKSGSVLGRAGVKLKRAAAWVGIGAAAVYGGTKAVKMADYNAYQHLTRAPVAGPVVAGIERFGDRALAEVSFTSKQLLLRSLIGLASGYTACRISKRDINRKDMSSFKSALRNAPEFVVAGAAGVVWPGYAVTAVGGYWIIHAVGWKNIKKGAKAGYEKILTIKKGEFPGSSQRRARGSGSPKSKTPRQKRDK